MTRKKGQGERRSEVRSWVEPSRVSWRREDDTCTHGGWTTDRSASGVAFLTATRNLPAEGEQIELTLESETSRPMTRLARVVRSEQHDSYFSLVACCCDVREGDRRERDD